MSDVFVRASCGVLLTSMGAAAFVGVLDLETPSLDCICFSLSLLEPLPEDAFGVKDAAF
jgi:hypothetical protein